MLILTHVFVFVITAFAVLRDIIIMAITILVPVRRIICFAVAGIPVPVPVLLGGVHFDVTVVREYYGYFVTTTTVMRGRRRRRRVILIHFFHGLFRFIAIVFRRLYNRCLYRATRSRRDAIRR